MTLAVLRNLTETSPVIRVAIVCGPRTNVLGDSIEELLAEAKGFTFSRFEYHSKSGVKPDPAGIGVPDVVVATLGAFQATDTGLFLASLQRAFSHRSVLVTTTDPNTFDFFRVLEMGASDFAGSPLRLRAAALREGNANTGNHNHRAVGNDRALREASPSGTAA